METLTVQLRRGVPKHKQLLFTRKKMHHQRNRQISTTCSKMPPRSSMVYPDPLSPTSSTSAAMKTPENTKQDPDNPEPADKGDESSGTLLQPDVQSKEQ
jgi:hypothetical protein